MAQITTLFSGKIDTSGVNLLAARDGEELLLYHFRNASELRSAAVIRIAAMQTLISDIATEEEASPTQRATMRNHNLVLLNMYLSASI